MHSSLLSAGQCQTRAALAPMPSASPPIRRLLALAAGLPPKPIGIGLQIEVCLPCCLLLTYAICAFLPLPPSRCPSTVSFYGLFVFVSLICLGTAGAQGFPTCFGDHALRGHLSDHLRLVREPWCVRTVTQARADLDQDSMLK